MSYELPPTEPNSEEPSNALVFGESLMSRRDVLRGAGITALSIALGKNAHTEERVSSQETLDEYATGLKRLHHESIQSDHEHTAIYRHMPDGTGIWEFQEIGGGAYAYIGTPESVAEKVDASESVEMFHTHPLALVYRDAGILERARKGEIPRMAMPPSFRDVSAAIITAEALGEARSGRVSWRVADPVGVWSFAPDRKHPSFAKIASFLRLAENMAKQIGEQAEVRTIIEKHRLIDQDPSLIFGFLLARMQELPSEVNALLEDILKSERELLKDPAIKAIIDIEASQAGFAPDAPELVRLREEYAKIGVAIEFTIHP